MGFQIQDGTGGGYLTKVGVDNRMHTDSLTRDEYAVASRRGGAYTVNSGYITLSAASATSGILFLKNNGDKDLVLNRFNLSCKDSAGTTQTHGRFIFYRNPSSMSGGSGNSATQTNLNFGSSNSLDISTEVGQNGATFTSLTSFGSPVTPLQNITFVDSVALIPKGASLGISFVTPTGNTSVQVAVGLNIYELDAD